MSDPALLQVTRPARYTPYSDGVFHVRPGLKAMGTPFGNGVADERYLQIDNGWDCYRANTADALGAHRERYRGTARLSHDVTAAALRFLVDAAVREWPGLFARDAGTLRENLTGSDMDLADPEAALDALSAIIQEDVAICCLDGDTDWLAYVHVTAPNYWNPSEKVGRSFANVHAPVPGMDDTNQKAVPLLQGIARGAAYVRFVWGLTADASLNHHPERITSAHRFAGRETISAGDVFVRVERQVLVGLAEVNAVLFLIRTYVEPLAALTALERAALAAGLRSMTPEARKYKGLDTTFDAVLAVVEEGESR